MSKIYIRLLNRRSFLSTIFKFMILVSIAWFIWGFSNPKSKIWITYERVRFFNDRKRECVLWKKIYVNVNVFIFLDNERERKRVSFFWEHS